jgi:hypothetical protein
MELQEQSAVCVERDIGVADTKCAAFEPHAIGRNLVCEQDDCGAKRRNGDVLRLDEREHAARNAAEVFLQVVVAERRSALAHLQKGRANRRTHEQARPRRVNRSGGHGLAALLEAGRVASQALKGRVGEQHHIAGATNRPGQLIVDCGPVTVRSPMR